MKLTISNEPVHFSFVATPKESPAGILDNATAEIRFDPQGLNRTFHVIEQNGNLLECIDIETGEIITLDFSKVWSE